MIPEYRFYQGAVLCELVDAATMPLSIREVTEGGRLGYYILNDEIGLQVKHSAARLPPWSFTLKDSHFSQLLGMRADLRHVFLVLVCGETGMLSLTVNEVLEICEATNDDQYWLRVTRRPGGIFSVSGSKGSLRQKKRAGLPAVVAAIEGQSATSLKIKAIMPRDPRK